MPTTSVSVRSALRRPPRRRTKGRRKEEEVVRRVKDIAIV